MTRYEVGFIERSKEATEGRQGGRQNLKRAVSKSIGFIASDGPDQFRRPDQFSFEHAIKEIPDDHGRSHGDNRHVGGVVVLNDAELFGRDLEAAGPIYIPSVDDWHFQPQTVSFVDRLITGEVSIGSKTASNDGIC